MEYIDHGQCYTGKPPYPYGQTLLACPRRYEQDTASVANFFYEPGADKYIAHILLHAAYWPSWDARRYEFSAEDGAWLNRDSVLSRSDDSWIGIWGAAYTQNATLGSFSKIYACRNCEYYIREVLASCGEPVAGGWAVNPYTWNPKSIYRFAVVNRYDNLLVGASSWTLDMWRNIGATPERYATLRLPNVLNALTYESKKYCWAITQDEVILKADYQIPRWEMISTVQNPTSDTKAYRIAFDTKRKRIAVFRHRQDAADGACQNQLEFYYPMVNAGQLTQPVPVTSLRAGNRIILAAHLIGDAGEGLTPYTVEGELLAPVEGRLTTPFSNTELNGRVCFQYQAPDEACEETLKLDVTVEESL